MDEAYIQDALTEMDRVYAAKGAESALIFIRVALGKPGEITPREIAWATEEVTRAWEDKVIAEVGGTEMFDGRLLGWWGRDCAKCGKPVHPPTNRYMKAAHVLNDRIWHGDCFPPEGVSGTFSVNHQNNGQP